MIFWGFLVFVLPIVFGRFPQIQTMQEKIKNIRPMPISVVFIEKVGETIESARAEFRKIRSAGFTGLKQVITATSLAQSEEEAENHTISLYLAALDEGLVPWWYEQGGWDAITDSLLDKLGISTSTPLPEILADSRMVSYQNEVLKKRAMDMFKGPSPGHISEPGRGSPLVVGDLVAEFAKWLEKENDGNITRLQERWEYLYRNISTSEFTNFSAAALLVSDLTTDISCGQAYCESGLSMDFQRYRDSMRFQTDYRMAFFGESVDAFHAFDAEAPLRTGVAMVMDNDAQNAWSLYDHGMISYFAGSFYASLHLPWHLSLMDPVEIDFPVYFTERLVQSAAPLGWVGEWESTGGPTFFSGGQSAGVSPGQIRRMFFNYLASGIRGIGLWTWNARSRGQEGGGYALTTLSGSVGRRAEAAGAVAKAMQRLRYEMWDAEDMPVVGILTSWENDAMLARITMQGPPMACEVSLCEDFYKERAWAATKSKLGIARALTQQNVPWAFIHEEQVLNGLAMQSNSTAKPYTVVNSTSFLDRFQSIFVPGGLALPSAVLQNLRAYVQRGGRVVADAPVAMFSNGSFAVTTPDSEAGKAVVDMFGCFVEDYSVAYSTPAGLNLTVGSDVLEISNKEQIFFATELTCSNTSKVVSHFHPVGDGGDISPTQGPIAQIESSFGKGSASLLTFEASKLNWNFSPSKNRILNNLLLSATLPPSTHHLPFTVTPSNLPTLSLFRRRVPRISPIDGVNDLTDHIFVINSAQTPATLTYKANDAVYLSAQDAVTQTTIPTNNSSITITVPAGDALWIRAIRKN